jgi:Mismatch repair ATPase (MutS family)
MGIQNKRIRRKLTGSFGTIKDETFNFELIEAYFRKKKGIQSGQIISDKTWNDLDLQEFFMFADRTVSVVGQQYSYFKLRTIDENRREKDFENFINKFTSDTEYRLGVQQELYKLKSKEAFYISSLFQDEHLKQPKWLFVARMLSAASLFSLILLFFNPAMVFVLFSIILVNFIIHYWNKKNLTPYIASIPQLLKLNSVAKELYKDEALKGLNPELFESIAVLDKVRNRMSFFKLEAKLQGDLEAVAWGILEFFKIVFLIEPILLFNVLGQLDTKRREIEQVFAFVGQVDMLISIASLRQGLDSWCKPDIFDEYKTLSARDIYHPLIPGCIRNSIEINGKSVLLTGSNMSGKTSFIRTIGLNAISGLALNTCFGLRFSFPPTRIFSAIRISDDLMNDKSYYFEEVLTIKEMIDSSQLGYSNLFLLDEIFKGTNTVERISAGKAVLSALNKANNLVFVSTHDIELADLLKDEYELYHFSETVNHQTVDFDYKLKEGKLKNRNAIRILQLNGYPETIIEEAIGLSSQMDKAKLNLS